MDLHRVTALISAFALYCHGHDHAQRPRPCDAQVTGMDDQFGTHTHPRITASRRRLPISRNGYLLLMARHNMQRNRLNSPLRNAALLVLLTAITIPIVLALAASGTFAAMTLILGG